MSDFEGRLVEALREGSQDAPDAVGLADAARGRARARRRTRAATVGVAAVVALAVPVAVVALGGDGDGRAPVADDSTGADARPDGRWESWHGVTVRVPEDWKYGDQAAWCSDGGSVETFRVTRPGGVTPSIACTPGSSYGLSFQEIEMDEDDEPFDWPVVTQTGDAWPPGTYVGAHGENGVLVTVAGPDREQLLDVLATVTAIGDQDPNGCGPDRDRVSVPTGGLAVCRYDKTGAIEQSELLTGDEASRAERALAHAPDAEAPACLASEDPPPGVSVRLVSATVDATVFLGCGWLRMNGDTRAVPSDVLFWALSPGWSGSVGGGVLLPEHLRR